MKTSRSTNKKKKLTPFGFIVAIGAMLLAMFLYFYLGIDQLFVRFEGLFGLSDIAWAFIGGMIWLFLIMGIITPIVFKVGVKNID